LGLIATLLGVLIMLVFVIDVGMRQLFSHGLTGSSQYVVSLLVAMAFLGMGEAERRGRHVAFDLATDSMPRRMSYLIQSIANTIVMFALVWLTWLSVGAAVAAMRNAEVVFGEVALPVWPAKALLALGLGGYVLQLSVSVTDCWRSAIRGEAVGIWRDREHIAETSLVER